MTAVTDGAMIGRRLAWDIRALGSNGVACGKTDGPGAVVVAYFGSEGALALDFVAGLSSGTLGQCHLGAAAFALA